ncbi:AMP-binding protein [Teredinibacter turnerae]|uniref:AMP-binding protein n=1 Tax=Teredinibacter turnerae TaxID=2426 RepID=UPI0003759613|nr:AMP-binding protein [Teredinibacter turnerae]
MVALIPRYKNVLEILDHAFTSYGHSPAYSCLGQSMTYAQLDELSLRAARYFRNVLGLQEGDRIAIQLPNLLQYPVVLYGAFRAGLVVVNINPLYTPREIKHQLVDSGSRALVVLSNIAHNAAEIVRETAVEAVIVTDIGDCHGFVKRTLMNFVVKHVKKMVPPFHFPNSISFDDIVASHGDAFPKVVPDPETLLILQYTGGTTGLAKGAMLSHRNMAENVWQMVSFIPEAFDESKEIYVCCLPLYHIYALNLHGLCAFSNGGHNVLIPNPRDLASMVKALKPHKFTVFVGINTLYTALCRYEPFKSLDFSALDVSSAGGMALNEAAASCWEKMTGCEVCEGYGLTETSPVVAGNRPGHIRQGYVGSALPETEVKLIDENGNTVVDQAGELCVRGPQVMQGYWHREDETANVLDKEGWLKTGDIAEISEDGFIKIVDRKKDMILVSGFNVYPNEIEDTVTQLPEVLEAAAIGVPNEKCGEVVKLFVVAADETLSSQQIVDFCRKNLTAYKVPKEIEFRESLPKSNVGKILRKDLRSTEHNN